jgi:hypothetical protein
MWRAEQEVSMTAEEFAEAVDELNAAAREGGLSDAEMTMQIEKTMSNNRPSAFCAAWNRSSAIRMYSAGPVPGSKPPPTGPGEVDRTLLLE